MAYHQSATVTFRQQSETPIAISGTFGPAEALGYPTTIVLRWRYEPQQTLFPTCTSNKVTAMMVSSEKKTGY